MNPRILIGSVIALAVVIAILLTTTNQAQSPPATEGAGSATAPPADPHAKGVDMLAGPDKAATPTDMKTLTDRVSYGFGLQMGASLKKDQVPIDPDMLAQGIKDAIAGAPSKYKPEEIQESMMQLQQYMMAKAHKAAEEAKAKAPQIKAESAAFMAKNKTATGVKSTTSGLQYTVINEGTGKSPAKTDTVTVHYKGTLLDGKVFDSSYDRGQPAEFPVGGVIPGWTEALQLMKVGGKYKLWIPSELAYGDQGAGQDIPPGAALIFEVELLGVK